MDKVSALKGKSFNEHGKTYKGIGGANRLSQKAIKSIQVHYGGAIRENVGNLQSCPAVSVGDLERANKRAFPEDVLDAIKPVFEVLSAES